MKTSQHISRLLREQADASKNIVFIVGNNAKFLYFNKAWLDHRGSSLEEELLRSPHAFLHSDDADAFASQLNAFRIAQEPSLLEGRLRDGDGNHAWFRFIVAPVFSAKGTFLGGIAHGHESVDKKRLEEDVNRFSAVMSTPEAGIIIKDKKGRITDWNIGAQNIMGYSKEEMLGKTSDVYTYQPDLDAIAEISRRLSSGEMISFTQTKVHHKSGRLILCSTTFSPIFDTAGNMSGSVVFFHDVTEEKTAIQKRLEVKAALRKSYEDIAAILNEIPTPICVVNESEGHILGCNSAFAEMCSSCEADTLGRPLTEYFRRGGELGVDFAEHILEQLRADDKVSCRLKKADGGVADVELTGRPLTFQEQKAFAIHCLDLSRRRKQEQILREAAEAAQEASKMKSAFLANMSHEIRTPLNGVIGFAELALDEPHISEAVGNYLRKIKVSANGLLEIINDVLDISKIEAGKIDLEKAPFSLHDDILQVCETIIGPRAEEKGVTLYLYSEPLVSRKFVGDQTRLRQILLNLLSNAIKFTNVGIVKLMSSVEEAEGDKITVYFEIKDSGIGMTPEQIRRIFEPFTQADNSTTRKYGGTGLGLTITKNLIELMGGKLQVESAPGIGSKFSFALTLDTVADADAPRLDVPPQITRDKPLFKGEVLVCEDNIINQQVIREHLAKVGLEAVIMANGKLGVDQVKTRLKEKRPFDLILMDIHMPVMDGLEATEKLLELDVKTPIIALTANAMSTDRKKYLNHGMSDYLAKPFRAHDLWDCLLRHLEPVGSTRPVETPPCEMPLKAVDDAVTPSTPSVINRALGFENAVGNATLYKRLQNNFLNDNKDAFARFREALDADNLTLAHRMAHTLKSVSAMLGAMELSDIARDLETALSDGRPALVREALPTFSAALEAVLRELALEETKQESHVRSGLTDRKKALELIAKLDPLLHDADADCLEYLEAVKTLLSPLGEKGRLLETQISDYDFELAAVTLQEVKADLEMKHD